MSTLTIVLHLLLGSGRHSHWQVYVRRSPLTQSMLCNDRAARLRAEAPSGPRFRLEIGCRRAMDGA